MSSPVRSRTGHRVWALAVYGGALLSAGIGVGCAAPGEEDVVEFSSTDQAITAVAGDPLPGTDAVEFAAAKTAFEVQDAADDGLGPIFNEVGCAVCHSLGATGGAGTQIERRFGRLVNGVFDTL